MRIEHEIGEEPIVWITEDGFSSESSYRVYSAIGRLIQLIHETNNPKIIVGYAKFLESVLKLN